MLEGKDADEAVANASRKTTSRRDLSRHNRFDDVSPEVGVLDEQAFDEVFDDNPDEALSMLADLVGATDERLRSLAQRLAALVIIAAGSAAQRNERGIGRLVSRPLSKATGDLDLDGSLDAIVELATGSDPHAVDHLRVHAWRRPQVALCLLVDRSGSMHGDRLATAAVAASAVLFRNADSNHNTQAAVAAFAQDTIVLTSPLVPRSPETVVTNLLRLRGHGVTDLATALSAAADLLADTNAARRVTVLLSDCRVTEGGHALTEAANLDELVILAPADDTADAEAFARKVGAKWAPVAGPMDVPTALARVLD